jgi:hypothetical protein
MTDAAAKLAAFAKGVQISRLETEYFLVTLTGLFLVGRLEAFGFLLQNGDVLRKFMGRQQKQKKEVQQ